MTRKRKPTVSRVLTISNTVIMDNTVIAIITQSNINIATVVSIIVAITGVIFGFLQYRLRKKEAQNSIVSTLNETRRKDDEILSFFRKIDYGEHWYGYEFHNSPQENIADRMLLFYEDVLRYRDEGSLKKHDFESFKYQIYKIVKNKDAQCYFFNLYHHSMSNNSQFPFQRLLDYGIDNGWIDKQEFEDKASDKFKKILVF